MVLRRKDVAFLILAVLCVGLLLYSVSLSHTIAQQNQRMALQETIGFEKGILVGTVHGLCRSGDPLIIPQAERMLPILQARKLISPEAPLHSCADLARVVTWDK